MYWCEWGENREERISFPETRHSPAITLLKHRKKKKKKKRTKMMRKEKIHKKERKKEITTYKTSFHIVIALFVKENDDMHLLHKIELKGNEGKEKNMKIRI